jgi:hypothetical protein
VGEGRSSFLGWWGSEGELQDNIYSDKSQLASRRSRQDESMNRFHWLPLDTKRNRDRSFRYERDRGHLIHLRCPAGGPMTTDFAAPLPSSLPLTMPQRVKRGVPRALASLSARTPSEAVCLVGVKRKHQVMGVGSESLSCDKPRDCSANLHPPSFLWILSFSSAPGLRSPTSLDHRQEFYCASEPLLRALVPDLGGKFARLDDQIAWPWQGCTQGSTCIPHSAGPRPDSKHFLQRKFALSSDTPVHYANSFNDPA